jgi:DNA mismatch repair protein MutS
VQARKKLSQLEEKSAEGSGSQADLFAQSSNHADITEQTTVDAYLPSEPSAIEIAIQELDPDSLSPKQALEALYQLKNLLK